MTCEGMPGLPSDVWAKIFEQLLPQLPCDESRGTELRKREHLTSDICEFQVLQQVSL